MNSDNPAHGAFLVVGAALMMASMGVLVRFASLQMPHEQIVFFRNLFGLLILVPLLLRRGDVVELKTGVPLLHLARALFGLAAMYCFFYALSHLPLATAVLLNFTAPLFIPFIALFWLGERVPHRVAIAILTGFCGVLFVLKPGSGVYAMTALVGLASGCLAAVAMVCLRKMSATEPPLRVVVWFGLIATTVSLVPMLWNWQLPDLQALVYMAAAGSLATAGQYLLSRGYGYAPAAQIGPYSYTSVVFAAGYGWYFWQEVPDWVSFIGTLLIVIAGVLAVQRRRPVMV